jgi:ABC-type dipeptide/oligopeptide/nickel transport systems, permease components
MYRKYLVKRIIYGILMYIVMIFTYSALFNRVAEETVRAQIEEQVAQEAIKYKNVTPEKLKAIIADSRNVKIHQYHLDESYIARVCWRAVDTITFNYGNSTLMKAPNGDREVLTIIGNALPRTIVLFTLEVLLVVVLGVWLGLYAARRPNGPLDKTISMVTMITNGLPAWWLGMLMIMFFSYAVPIFPSGGLFSTPAPTGLAVVPDFLWHLALPLITLVLLGVWSTAYLVRNIVLSNLQEDFVMAARARGIPERKVLFGHTLRTSMPAIMTMAILSLFSSIAGNILVEGIFGWPGIGNLYFIAVQQSDVPVLMGTLSIETFINMLGFVLLDLIYGLLDPRIKVGGKA